MTETMIVNGFEVPAGVDLTKCDPNKGIYYVPYLNSPSARLVGNTEGDFETDDEFGFYHKYRLLYENEDDALKRALAMLGIDPKHYATFRDGYKEKFNKNPVFKYTNDGYGGAFSVKIIDDKEIDDEWEVVMPK